MVHLVLLDGRTPRQPDVAPTATYVSDAIGAVPTFRGVCGDDIYVLGTETGGNTILPAWLPTRRDDGDICAPLVATRLVDGEPVDLVIEEYIVALTMDHLDAYCKEAFGDDAFLKSVCNDITRSSVPDMSADDTVDLTIRSCAAKAVEDPRWLDVAAWLFADVLQRRSAATFSSYVAAHSNPLQPAFVAFVKANAAALDAAVRPSRDKDLTYFGLRTLERSYLLRGETPQYMMMRVAVGIHHAARAGEESDPVAAVLTTYAMLSERKYTHATPTMFNAGTKMAQLASCFLLQMKGDSIDGIFETLHDCARISKLAGGIGLGISDIRASGSKIKGTDGTSSGIVPMIRVFDATGRYVDQAGKRKGSIAMYLEPWHADVEAFLDLRKNHGAEELRARDIFTALWVPDEFMRRLQDDAPWSLFCPNEVLEATGQTLSDCHSAAFDELYARCEAIPGLARKTLPARQLWGAVLDSQIQTGTPYLLFKDACNRKSNQQHLGTIRCSNLCVEIVEYTAPDETAVCNLASVCLPTHLKGGAMDFAALEATVEQMVVNLDAVIDATLYPTDEARRSNLRHRPIGIGVQGLADVFMALGMPYESDEAVDLDARIFEAIYLAAVRASVHLARDKGSYPSYDGSPASKGQLQFDLWDATPRRAAEWEAVKRDMADHGLRNSLLTAPMPTASSAQIQGFTESFEPLTNNLYTRRTLSGEFVVFNRYLFEALRAADAWDNANRTTLIADDGRVGRVRGLTDDQKKVFKTVFEMKQRRLLDHAAARAPFVDQSQSMNIYFAEPSAAKLTACHTYAWKKGLKTGSYYIRTLPKARTTKFALDERDQQRDCVGCSS